MVMPVTRRQLGAEVTLVVSSTSVPVTTAAPAGTRHALLSVSGNTIRMRCDGTDPLTTAGLVLPVGVYDFFMNPGMDFSGVFGLHMEFIAVAADGEVNILWFD